MKLYKRPPAPDDFPTKVKKAREKAEKLVEARLKATSKKALSSSKRAVKGGGEPAQARKKDKAFQELWGKYKPYFAYAQFGKCGFCEGDILTTNRGDVEHYRPKSAISVVDEEDTPVLQFEASAGVKERKFKVISGTGYYWLAYEWNNYLLSCAICNQSFKGTIFPVKANPRALPPLKDAPDEDALLLNPFDTKEPSKHLEFRRDGFVKAKSAYGRATIDTCGLYRDTLITARGSIAARVYDLALDLPRPPKKRENPQVLKNCYDVGCDDAPHCGMARAIIEEVGKMRWEDLVKKRAKELALQMKKAKGAYAIRVLDAQMEKMGREGYDYYAAVREIFEKTCGMTWEELLVRLTRQMARDLLADKSVWNNDRQDELTRKKTFYLLARNNPAYAVVIQATFEKHARVVWTELIAFVESLYKPIWTLEDVLRGFKEVQP